MIQPSSHNSITTSDVESGVVTPASSVPIDTISTKMESAVKSKALASNSTFKKESANNAIKATPSSTEDARESTKTRLTILDALFGLKAFVSPAQRDGTSMLKMSASQSVTSAQLGMKPLVLAILATTDPLSKMEPVSPMSILASYLSQTFYAKPGQKNHASSAQKEVSSMLMDFAWLLALNAILSIKLPETVFHVLPDMTMSTDNAFSHQQTPPHQVISDVPLGIGRTRNVWPAQRDGLSMLKISAYQLLTNVKLTLIMEIVHLATRDMT